VVTTVAAGATIRRWRLAEVVMALTEDGRQRRRIKTTMDNNNDRNEQTNKQTNE
jgi:hypothetical protein